MSPPLEPSKHVAAQDWRQAEEALRRAADTGSAGADVFYDLAKVLEAAGKHDQMASWLKRAVRDHPGHSKAWLELGAVFCRQGAHDSARKCFETVAALSRDDSVGIRRLGDVTLRYGHWQIAERCFGAAMDPDARIARYKIACETGRDTWVLRQELMSDPQMRPRLLHELSNVSKGGFALRF